MQVFCTNSINNPTCLKILLSILNVMKLPKGFNEVTISAFHKCFAITNLYKGKTDLISVTDRDVKVVATLAKVPFEEVEALKGNQFDEYKAQVAFIYGTPKNEKLPIEFDCSGKHYKSRIFFEEWKNFSPLHRKDLGTVLKMKGGQIIDYTDLRWGEESDSDYIYNMHKLLACVCVPAGEDGKYTYNGYLDTAEEFLQHLTMDIAYPLMLFFSNVGTSYYQNIRIYFQNQLKQNLKTLKKTVSQKEETAS